MNKHFELEKKDRVTINTFGFNLIERTNILYTG